MPPESSSIAVGLAIFEYVGIVLIALIAGFILLSRSSRTSEPEDSGASPDSSEKFY